MGYAEMKYSFLLYNRNFWETAASYLKENAQWTFGMGCLKLLKV